MRQDSGCICIFQASHQLKWRLENEDRSPHSIVGCKTHLSWQNPRGVSAFAGTRWDPGACHVWIHVGRLAIIAIQEANGCTAAIASIAPQDSLSRIGPHLALRL